MIDTFRFADQINAPTKITDAGLERLIDAAEMLEGRSG